MLSLQGIAKTFNRGEPNERVALQGIDLELARGDFAVVIGSNGAGKSTLLNVLAGDLAPDAGRVAIDGREVTGLAAHRRSRFVARVFQDPAKGTAPGLTVAENLALAERRGRRRGLRQALPRSRRQRHSDALAPLGLGLENRLDTPVESLSGGQRQALSLVMAVLLVPDILVLDEHCAALDPRTAAIVMEATVAAVARARITTLMVTHNMQHAILYGDRLLMMHEGRVQFELRGEEKAGLSVEALVRRFGIVNDQFLLSG